MLNNGASKANENSNEQTSSMLIGTRNRTKNRDHFAYKRVLITESMSKQKLLESTLMKIYALTSQQNITFTTPGYIHMYVPKIAKALFSHM